jgi:hypothetical protein
MYAFTTLMRLNHPVASRQVPGYVPALRRTVLAIWLIVCFISGLAESLNGFSLAGFFLFVFMSGATMLLISAPLRWPVQWFLFLVGLVWFLKHSYEFFAWGPINALVSNKAASLTFVTLVYAGMGWLITHLITNKGSAYASLFSRFLAAQHSERVVDKPDASSMPHLGPWLKAYAILARGATLPWHRYTSFLLARPKPGPGNAIARAELGFGPVVHWATQLSFSGGLALVVVAVWWFYAGQLLDAEGRTSPLTAIYIAIASFLCAATAPLYIGDVLMRTQGEQKLMLLLPGMPVGNPLSRALAVRHLCQAFAAWALANAWVLVLPYPDNAAIYVAAFCWGTLPLVPFVVQDWAKVRPPDAVHAIGTLVLTLLGPVVAWVALRWLHLPSALLAGMAIGICLLILHMRWSHLARFAQALPVGRL